MTAAPPRDPTGLELSIVVPCYNEELNVPELTERVLSALEMGKLRAELVLVDDGSKDRTAEVIRQQEAAYPGRVLGVFHAVNGGMARAWRSGVEAARGANIALIDADLQYQPEDVLRLYRTLRESSVDIVQGWRSSVGRLKDGRYLLSRGLNTILNRAFNMNLRDNKSGFICCAREVLLDLFRYEGRYAYWQSFIMVAAHARGYSYREIETLFSERKQGTSFLDGHAYRAAAKNFVDVGNAFLEYRLQRKPLLTRPDASAPPERSARVSRARFLPTILVIGEATASRRNIDRQLELLDESQWLSPERLRELQEERLRRLMRHAYRNVAYYRARMRELKLHPDDVRTLDDLAKLPLLNKHDIRKHLHFDLMQEGVSHADLVRITTSGNTGEPFVCYADRRQVEFRIAAALRARSWTGHRDGDAWFRVSHDPQEIELSETWEGRRQLRRAACQLVPISHLTEARLGEICDQFVRARPSLIEGDTEMLVLLAQRLAARGVTSTGAKAVVTFGQTLSDRARKAIEEAFGGAVFDAYGCRELARIAEESDSHQGHLVASEGFIVEVLVDGRPAAPGELGEVVVTDLSGFAMPLIRYRLGDMAEAAAWREKSPCGRGLARLGRIYGRPQSILRGSDGRLLPGSFLSDLVRERDYAIQRLNVIHEQPGDMTLEIVKGARYSDDVLSNIVTELKDQLGHDLAVRIQFVDKSAEEQPVSRSPISFTPPSAATQS